MPANIQGELQGEIIAVISLGLIFVSIFYMFLFERFTRGDAAFYCSGTPFGGVFCVLVFTMTIFALRVCLLGGMLVDKNIFQGSVKD